MTLRIEQMYAFVVLDPADDTEGIIAFQAGPGNWMPMVGADMDRVNSLRGLAQKVATEQELPVRLLRFEVRTELEVIHPCADELEP